MDSTRLEQINQMCEGWNETDQYDEDSEKTCAVDELLAELQRLQAMHRSGTAG